MRLQIPNLFSTLSLALLMAIYATAQAEDRSELPERLKVFEKHCGVEEAETWFALLVEHLGPSDRLIGSGVRTFVWNVAGGTLSFQRYGGPIFFDPETRKSTSLLCTRTLVREEILGDYQMNDLPDERGSRTWLGSLKFDQSGGYSFKPANDNSCSVMPPRVRNFFIDHPQGHFILKYMSGISGESMLESLGDGVNIARLHFSSADGKARASYVIQNSTNWRRLVFSADDAMVFGMETSWETNLKRRP